MKQVLFVGDDWSEEHHDVELQDEDGRRLGKAKLAAWAHHQQDLQAAA